MFATQILLGGQEGISSSCVFDGTLIPIASESHSCIRRVFQQHLQHEQKRMGSTTEFLDVRGGIVAIDGGFKSADLDAHGVTNLATIHLVFVSGDVDAQTMDSFANKAQQHNDETRPRVLLCVPVPSYQELASIARLSGAYMVQSWRELLPTAIGHKQIQVRLVEISSPERISDDDGMGVCNKYGSTLFLQVRRAQDVKAASMPRCLFKTLLVRGATQSEANELQQQVRKALHRILNTLQTGQLLPSSGAFLCACAAELRMHVDQLQPQYIATSNGNSAYLLEGHQSIESAIVLERIVDALSQLSATLLQNTGEDSMDLLHQVAKVRHVQRNYVDGIQSVGCEKFYAACPFSSAEYCALPKRKTPRRPHYRFDVPNSTEAAFRKSFRVLELLLNIGKYTINSASSA
uniref:Uncharacterized protein n=1 Tax=Globisporangium ultimum (strain ATCC 200006 / CBS 805.95 / DAOM BR144) TaxID=431595 RepID=K3WS68_GLOUD